MLESKEVTTARLISLGKNIIEQYDAACKKGLFSVVPNWLAWLTASPGEEGASRRRAFILTVNGIKQDDSPEIAFVKLFQFYVTHNSSSRLIRLLEVSLGRLVGVNIPQLVVGPHSGNLEQYAIAYKSFMEKARSIKKNMQ